MVGHNEVCPPCGHTWDRHHAGNLTCVGAPGSPCSCTMTPPATASPLDGHVTADGKVLPLQTGPASVSDALAADLDRLAALGAPFSATLAATARALARSLDSGPENTTASVAKELRATLDKLAEGVGGDRGPDLSGLSAPVHGRP